MRTTAQLRELWGPKCSVEGDLEIFHTWCGQAVQVRKGTRPWWAALDAVMQHHGYRIRSAGGYNCRPITGGKGLSTHAFAIAVDFNPKTNPYGREFITDMSPEMVADIYAIRTPKGVQAFAWGGDWDGDGERDETIYDAMHLQLNLSPCEALETPTVNGKPAPVAVPVIEIGAKGETVRVLQKALNKFGAGLKVDGGFGPLTQRALKRFQESRGLLPDGVAGPLSWASLGVKW